jgi:hypothetical protein
MQDQRIEAARAKTRLPPPLFGLAGAHRPQAPWQGLLTNELTSKAVELYPPRGLERRPQGPD